MRHRHAVDEPWRRGRTRLQEDREVGDMKLDTVKKVYSVHFLFFPYVGDTLFKVVFCIQLRAFCKHRRGACGWRDEGEGKLDALSVLLMPIISRGVCYCQWRATRWVVTKA